MACLEDPRLPAFGSLFSCGASTFAAFSPAPSMFDPFGIQIVLHSRLRICIPFWIPSRTQFSAIPPALCLSRRSKLRKKLGDHRDPKRQLEHFSGFLEKLEQPKQLEHFSPKMAVPEKPNTWRFLLWNHTEGQKPGRLKLAAMWCMYTMHWYIDILRITITCRIINYFILL